MFKLNDNVVYPGYGVAQIREIIEQRVGSSTISFMKLVFLFKDMSVLVPEYNAHSIGLRYPSSLDLIDRVFIELHALPERKLDPIDFTPSAWNKRNKEYQLKIQSGNIIELAKMYRDLMFVSVHKDLSFGERALLQTIEGLLCQEIQVATETTRDSTIQVLRQPFKNMVIHDTVDLHHKKPLRSSTHPS